MFNFRYLRRHLFIANSHGRLHARIVQEHRIAHAIFALVLSTFFLVMIGSGLIARCRGAGWSLELLYLLPLPVLLAVAYYILLRIIIWNSFGQEEIVVESGEMRWTCTALWFKDKLTATANEIAGVKAITPWHGRNFVELTTRGHSYRIGDPIKRDEAIQLEHALKSSIGLR